MDSINTYLLHIGEEDNKMLKKPLFNVNMRLYKDNPKYKKLIYRIIDYMNNLMEHKFSDYAPLKGVSGANIGIPFNIIVVANGESSNKIMINPHITKYFGKIRMVKSNCGSVRLKDSVTVPRHEGIVVSYYDIDGKHKLETFKESIASTIQHEVDHNLGITIMERSN